MKQKNKTINKMDGIHIRPGIHIITYSGKKFNYFEPNVDQVETIDIAKGLAYKPYFGGQTPKFFSIAEHCLLVNDLLPPKVPREIRLAALLHDAAEAYIGDMLSPIKAHLPLYCTVEDAILQAVFKKFNLEVSLLRDIKYYDLKAQEIEYDVFYNNNRTYYIKYLSPDGALTRYLDELIKWI